MKPNNHNLNSDEWLLKPRASDEMELTRSSFKAFGRLFILKLEIDLSDADEYGENNG